MQFTDNSTWQRIRLCLSPNLWRRTRAMTDGRQNKTSQSLYHSPSSPNSLGRVLHPDKFDPLLTLVPFRVPSSRVDSPVYRPRSHRKPPARDQLSSSDRQTSSPAGPSLAVVLSEKHRVFNLWTAMYSRQGTPFMGELRLFGASENVVYG